MSCRFAVVAHPFADDAERDALGFGGGGPAVAGDVESQGDCDADQSGDAFQVVIDVVAGVAVGTALVEPWVADDGQQVVARVFGVFVEYHLHLFCPFDDKLLAGLTTAIRDIAVFEVCLFQKRHINEAHSSEIETHKEHITGIVQRRSKRQIQRLDFLDDCQRQCSIDCLVHSGIDMAERIAVLDDVVLDRTVIDCA